MVDAEVSHSISECACGAHDQQEQRDGSRCNSVPHIFIAVTAHLLTSNPVISTGRTLLMCALRHLHRKHGNGDSFSRRGPTSLPLWNPSPGGGRSCPHETGSADHWCAKREPSRLPLQLPASVLCGRAPRPVCPMCKYRAGLQIPCAQVPAPRSALCHGLRRTGPIFPIGQHLVQLAEMSDIFDRSYCCCASLVRPTFV